MESNSDDESSGKQTSTSSSRKAYDAGKEEKSPVRSGNPSPVEEMGPKIGTPDDRSAFLPDSRLSWLDPRFANHTYGLNFPTVLPLQAMAHGLSTAHLFGDFLRAGREQPFSKEDHGAQDLRMGPRASLGERLAKEASPVEPNAVSMLSKSSRESDIRSPSPSESNTALDEAEETAVLDLEQSRHERSPSIGCIPNQQANGTPAWSYEEQFKQVRNRFTKVRIKFSGRVRRLSIYLAALC